MTTTIRNSANPAHRVAALAEEGEFYSELAKSAPLSDTIKGVELNIGEESDHEPAVWITIRVGVDDHPSDDKIKKVNRVAETIRTAVLNSDFQRWPHVHVETESSFVVAARFARSSAAVGDRGASTSQTS